MIKTKGKTGCKLNNRIIIFVVAGIFAVFAAGFGIAVLYRYNYIPHKKYTSEHFGIETYISSTDCDNDGVNDQTDILNAAKEYVATKPKYKSKYYSTGYPDDEYGVCTDVVAFALRDAGYDLRELVAQDIENNFKDYNIDVPDDKIDFRRVRNLKVYFANNAIPMTLDINDIEQWQGGDIVIFENHVGIVSDSRNKNGVPFVIHNGNSLQASYEEDILEIWGKIVGHYRMS